MFDRIARRYDLANRVLSLGLDRRWRRRVARCLPEGTGLTVLDLATGTGDQLLALLGAGGRVAMAIGLDPAGEMLRRAGAKVAARGWTGRARLVQASAEAVPLPDGACDAATMAFGIRNVPDVDRVLAEARRVLRPGGRLVLLEFSLPACPVVRALHLFYLRRVVPRIGGWLTGDRAAYRYLNETIETFPYGDAFLRRLAAAGFADSTARPMTFGVLTLYTARRPEGRW